mmetsp:Transcript_24144/g.66897  ORF Transcript_24144/g.66897 Transcript_24144/m.66897 type:complete len:181 (+) Transcript_24144:533-1075(+)
MADTGFLACFNATKSVSMPRLTHFTNKMGHQNHNNLRVGKMDLHSKGYACCRRFFYNTTILISSTIHFYSESNTRTYYSYKMDCQDSQVTVLSCRRTLPDAGTFYYCINRSINSAFLPETLSPRSRSISFSTGTVCFCKSPIDDEEALATLVVDGCFLLLLSLDNGLLETTFSTGPANTS